MKRWEPQDREPRRSGPGRAPVPVGFDARLAAAIIDGVWLMTLAVVLSPLLDKLKKPAGTGGLALDSGDLDCTLALTLWLFYSATEVLTAGTLGKRLLDVRVACRDGRPSSVRRRAARWLVKGSPLLLVAIPPVLRIACKYLPAVAPLSGAAGGATGGLDFATSPLAERLFHALDGAAAVAGIVVLVGGMGVFVPRAQALHDWVAGTAVYCDMDITLVPRHGFSPLLRALPLSGRPDLRWPASPSSSASSASSASRLSKPFQSFDKDVTR